MLVIQAVLWICMVVVIHPIMLFLAKMGIKIRIISLYLYYFAIWCTVNSQRDYENPDLPGQITTVTECYLKLFQAYNGGSWLMKWMQLSLWEILAQSSVYKLNETTTWSSRINCGNVHRKLKIPQEEIVLKLENLGHLLAWYLFHPWESVH